jgi:hypothetical protein
MVIEIQRHEHNGILTAFTMYFNNPEHKQVTLLVWDNELKVYFHKTIYRGHCSFGVPTPTSQATVFSQDTHIQDCEDFIQEHNLVLFGKHYSPWHRESTLRVILSNNDIARLLKDYPQFNAFADFTVVDGNYSYIYLGFIEPEHEQLLVYGYDGVVEPFK